MLTDRPPRRISHREQFGTSDQLISLPTPDDDRLRKWSKRIESAMRMEAKGEIRRACSDFIAAAAAFYEVKEPTVSVLAARPLRVREGGWSSELFGDYAPSTLQIRVWTHTAVLKKMTSFGTFFSTLCHEFCHHLDCRRFGLERTPHTRGFYQRAAVLYHHGCGTPLRRLVWKKAPGERWVVDWKAIRTSAVLVPPNR